MTVKVIIEFDPKTDEFEVAVEGLGDEHGDTIKSLIEGLLIETLSQVSED